MGKGTPGMSRSAVLSASPAAEVEAGGPRINIRLAIAFLALDKL